MEITSMLIEQQKDLVLNLLNKRKIEKKQTINKEAEPHKKIVDAFNLVDQLTTKPTNLQRQSEMEGFLNKANEMIEDANLSIKNYNKLIKEYETKGFFGKMFSEDPQAQESKIIVKRE